MRLAIAACIVLAGCSDDPCTTAIDHARIVIARTESPERWATPETQGAFHATLDAFRTGETQRCRADAWPTAMIECVSSAQTREALDACKAQLDPTKRGTYAQAFAAAAKGTGGNAGEPIAVIKGIANAAANALASTGSYPIADGALLPPHGPGPGANCCGGKDGECAPAPAQFAADPGWAALGISIDQPTEYQYSFTSDGHTLTARAIGDIDCDGTSETWTLTMGIRADGQPTASLQKPTP